jgi:hypothetical protein
MTKITKQIILTLVVIIAIFIGYKMIFLNSESDDTTLVAEPAPNAQFIDGQIILTLLDNLEKVTLDESIFSDKVFVSLVSFERPIPNQLIGRDNPFLPIGRGISNIGTNKSTQIR